MQAFGRDRGQRGGVEAVEIADHRLGHGAGGEGMGRPAIGGHKPRREGERGLDIRARRGSGADERHGCVGPENFNLRWRFHARIRAIAPNSHNCTMK